MTALPNLFDCVNPAIDEIIMAYHTLKEQTETLGLKVKDLTDSRSQKQAVSLALIAEDVSRTAFQIQELAAAVHRGASKRLELENRI